MSKRPDEVMAEQSAALRADVNSEPMRRKHDGPLTGASLTLIDKPSLTKLLEAARAEARRAALEEAAKFFLANNHALVRSRTSVARELRALAARDGETKR